MNAVQENVAANGNALVLQLFPQPWIDIAVAEIRLQYPDDLFEVVLRDDIANTPSAWRVRCLDCPGKLYMLGPGETLSNFEVHLKNKMHRQRVRGRIEQVNDNVVNNTAE